MPYWKPDRAWAFRRKARTGHFRCRAVRSLQSNLSRNNREMRALFAHLGEQIAEFLCSPDCVAEREGFEPAVQFSSPKPRCVRKLQVAIPQQRILSRNVPFECRDWSGFHSPSHRLLTATDRRLRCRKWSSCEPSGGRFGFNVTACPPHSPKRNVSPQGGLKKGQINEDFQRFLFMLCETLSPL
jgi:hypothetical protein